MKKFIAMLVMCAVVFSGAVGCGGDDKAKDKVKDTVKDTVKEKVKDTVKDTAK